MNERKSNPVPKLLKDWISLSRKRIHGANQSMDSPSNWLLIKSPTDIWSLSLRYQRLIYDRLRIKQKTWTKTTWPRKRSEKPKTTVPSTDPIWHDLYRLVQDRRGKSRNQWLLLLHWALYGRFVIAFYKKAQLKACHSNEQTSDGIALRPVSSARIWRNGCGCCHKYWDISGQQQPTQMGLRYDGFETQFTITRHLLSIVGHWRSTVEA